MADTSFWSRVKNGWNAFWNRDPTGYMDRGDGYFYRPDRVRYTKGSERTIIASIYNRIALDVAAIKINHVLVDENDRYKETIKSGLNECLTVSANLDQTARALTQDEVISMFDEGCIAVAPIETTPRKDVEGFDVHNLRVGKIIQWYADKVKIRVYNEWKAEYQDIMLPKSMVAIIENPFYAVMNQPNSTLQRLIRKLSILDAIDEQSGSGKLDLIIQLPYTIKTEARRQQADKRRSDIEAQLSGSKYGIAYTDGTERITQLNRPLENNLLKQIEYLTSMLYSQLTITQSVMDGTADEKTMLNYENRCIEPVVAAIVDEMKRKFLTVEARNKGESIMAFRDPFRLTPIANIAEIADKFTRNEILTSNEIRQFIGVKPSDDPKADQLVNSNISQPQQPVKPVEQETETYE